MLKHSRMKKKELLGYIGKDNALKAHMQKEETEIGEVVQIFDETKQHIECLRKQKNKEILQETIAKCAVTGILIITGTQAKDEVYLKYIAKARGTCAKREEEKIQKQIEKQHNVANILNVWRTLEPPRKN
ncbi:hypothetical protein QE152_g26969 [Popillia japonica]|uniref:Uncharacterized protein n=1 Tax=Popillia japonica TaxID=7064 RepID=A0AAW1JWL0_POPJA